MSDIDRFLNQIICGDCLEVMRDIPDKSVDMILCDLPYGQTSAKWDSMISLDELWKQYKRIIKSDGSIILTAIQPFTSILILSNTEMFRYEMVWEKTKTTGFMDAKYRPLRQHENIIVFSYSSPNFSSKIRGKYNPQGLIEVNKTRTIGKNKCTEIYNKAGIKHEGREYEQKYTNYPTTILRFKSEGKTIHPTQKPVPLFEYLIKTYTNEGETVLDNCIGSGTSGVAAINTDRNFIGIEKEPKYVEIARKRLEQAQAQQNLFKGGD